MLFLLDLISLTKASSESSSPIVTLISLVNFGYHFLRSYESSFSITQLIITKRMDPVRGQIRQSKSHYNFLYMPLITLDSGHRSYSVSKVLSAILLLFRPGKHLMRRSMVSSRTVPLTFWLLFLSPTSWPYVLTL